MSVNTILLSEFTDLRFRAAFQTYFAELGIAVKDWDGLFREIGRGDGGEKNEAYVRLSAGGGVLITLL